MCPISVFIPVAVTTASALPAVMQLPIWSMFFAIADGGLTLGVRQSCGIFLARQRFSGQHRFVGGERIGAQQPGICGYGITRLKRDDISGDRLLRRDALALSAAQDCGI